MNPFDAIAFRCGKQMPNRFMLAPLTNCQSHADGRLSDEEFRWLTMRAKGGFGLTMTCAAFVQDQGRAFPGQLGISGDHQLDGHRRLASALKAQGGLAVVQLHHGGNRCPSELIGTQPVSASASEAVDPDTFARALSTAEVETLRDDFIGAAARAQEAGYDGVEVHGAHGYIVCQFLSATVNTRTDRYGGSLANRQRLLLEIVEGIAQQCGMEFLLGVRLSPERFGILLDECLDTCNRLIDKSAVDFLDISLWDSFKEPTEESHRGRSLLSHFTELDRKDLQLTVAGKIHSAENVQEILASSVDFVTLGRAAILHHDFPQRMHDDADFEPLPLPVSRDHLAAEGLSDVFIDYMDKWKGFVAS